MTIEITMEGNCRIDLEWGYIYLKDKYKMYIRKYQSDLGNKYLTRLTDRNDKYYYNIIERGSLESLRKACLEIEDKLREGNNE